MSGYGLGDQVAGMMTSVAGSWPLAGQSEVHHIELLPRGGLTVIGNPIGLCLVHYKQITIITKRGTTYPSRAAQRV